MTAPVIHLVDAKRGRANVYSVWTACGKTARAMYVHPRTLSVTCSACFAAIKLSHPDAECDCGHSRKTHAGGRGMCAMCAARYSTALCDRFKFFDRSLLANQRSAERRGAAARAMFNKTSDARDAQSGSNSL